MSLNEGTLTYAQQIERYKASKDRIYKAAVPEKRAPDLSELEAIRREIKSIKRDLMWLESERAQIRREIVALTQLTALPENVRTLRGLIGLTSELAGLVPSDVCSPRRAYARARHIAMFLAKKFTAASYPEIARVFGGMYGSMDHSSVHYGVRRVELVVEKIGEPAGDTPEAWAQHLLTSKWPRVNPKRATRRELKLAGEDRP